MENIKIKLKDGSVREFKHVGRPGGSYTLRVRYDGGFVIVEDEYYNQTAFPAADVKEVVVESGDRGRL
jgi:hypothetical protein